MGTFPAFYQKRQARLPDVENNKGVSIKGLNLWNGTKSLNGMFVALSSNINQAGNFQAVFRDNNLNTAQYKYQKRALESEVTTGAIDTCSGGTETEWFEGAYSFTDADNVSVQFVIKDTDLLSIDNFNDGVMSDAQMAQFSAMFDDTARLKFDALTGVIEKKLLTEYEALRGFMISPVIPALTPIVGVGFNADGSVNQGFRRVVRREFRKQGVLGDLILVGGQSSTEYFDASVQSTQNVGGHQLEVGGSQSALNDAGQIIPQAVKGFLPYDSEYIDDAFSIDDVLIMAPGACQILTSNPFARANQKKGTQVGMDNTTEIKDTIMLSYGGVSHMVDLKMIRDSCNELWRITMSTKVKLFSPPYASLWKVGDKLANTNKLGRFVLSSL